MAKFDEMVSKYLNVSKTIANKFNSADTTPTRKYLEYLFKIWHNRHAQPIKFTSERLIAWVTEFEIYNHLIENKDIYSSVYFDITHLIQVIQNAKNLHDRPLNYRPILAKYPVIRLARRPFSSRPRVPLACRKRS